VTTESLVRVDPRDFAARRDAIAALDARTREIDGHESLGDAVWRDLDDPGADSAGFFLDDRAEIAATRWIVHQDAFPFSPRRFCNTFK